jgi:hypothetical protein
MFGNAAFSEWSVTWNPEHEIIYDGEIVLRITGSRIP